jgi:type II secretory pathway pseudopilin PulG
MRRRQAFTLVELLVSMALIIFIMAILTEAFSAGLTTFRQLKAIGDMQERMRSVTIVLRNDLMADHFYDTSRTNATKLSQIDLRTLDSLGNPNSSGSTGPPTAGYFRIWQNWQGFHGFAADPRTWNSTLEANSQGETVGSGGGQLPSTRATDQWLAFTCKVPAYNQDLTPRPEYIHFADLPPAATTPSATAMDTQGWPAYQKPGKLNSQWYEVAYFLSSTGQSAGSTPLYALYRRERVIFPGDTPPPAGTFPAGTWTNYPNVSIATNAQDVNNPGGATTSVTDPRRRFGMDGSNAGLASATTFVPLAGNFQGDDLLLSDVISFDIKVMLQQDNGGKASLYQDAPAFVDLPPVSATKSSRNSAFAAAGNGAVVFDTWSNYDIYSAWATADQNTSLPLQVRILAIQVTLRVWDNRTQQARQTAIIQDL